MIDSASVLTIQKSTFFENDGNSVDNRARPQTVSFGRTPMDVEVRVRAIEERLSEVESAQRDDAAAMRTLFELVQRIDANMTSLVARVQALETNFSLLNAAVVSLGAKVDALDARVAALETRVAALETRVAALETKVDALDAKVTVIDTKLDQILTLLRSPNGARPH